MRGDEAPAPGLVCLGEVTGARGVRGEVRIRSFAAVPEGVASYGPLTDAGGRARFRLTLTGVSGASVFARIDGVTDRDQALALKGQRLYVRRAELPPAGDDEFYHADLVGLVAEAKAGGVVGRVVAVRDHGAGPMLEVAFGDGPTVLVPFTRAAVPEVDVAQGRVVIDPPAGLFEPPAEGKRGTTPWRRRGRPAS